MAKRTRNDTLINYMRELSVDINGLIIPGRSVESVLARHSLNLTVVNDDDTFKISLLGSATAVRYKSRNILLTTQHQTLGIDEARVAMMTDTGEFAITSGGRRKFGLRDDTDANDIVAFDFTEPCAHHTELRKRFFDLRETPPTTPNYQVLAMLLTGYPSAHQVYEVYEKNHIGLSRLQVLCLPESQSHDQALLKVRAQNPLSEHPDGMSGGAAFVIQLQDGHPKAYFAGIIVRGGKDSFHILKAGFVTAFLDAVFN